MQLATNDCPFNDFMFEIIVKQGKLGIIKCLKCIGNTSNELHIFCAAVKQGNLDILDWLKANDNSFSAYSFELAITHGSLAVMNWLRTNGCPFE